MNRKRGAVEFAVRLLLAMLGVGVALMHTWPALYRGFPVPDFATAAFLALGGTALTAIWFFAFPVSGRGPVLVLPILWPILDGVIGFLIWGADWPIGETIGFGVGIAAPYAVFPAPRLTRHLKPLVGRFLATTPHVDIGERKRRAFVRYVVQRGMRDRRNLSLFRKECAIALIQYVLWIVGGGVLIFAINRWVMTPPGASGSWVFPLLFGPGVWLFGIAVFLLALAAIGITLFQTRRRVIRERSREYAQSRPCFECGACCEPVRWDDSGWSGCPDCGARVHRGQWIAPPLLAQGARHPVLKRRMWRLQAVLILAIPALLFLLLLLAPVSESLVPLAFIMALIGIAPLVLISADLRRGIALLYDRQHLRCRECQYDLTGAPVERGIGRCPECGVRFARYAEEAGEVAP